MLVLSEPKLNFKVLDRYRSRHQFDAIASYKQERNFSLRDNKVVLGDDFFGVVRCNCFLDIRKENVKEFIESLKTLKLYSGSSEENFVSICLPARCLALLCCLEASDKPFHRSRLQDKLLIQAQVALCAGKL